jgi:hypothetical protein
VPNDFTVLIDGASGPQPHSGFIEVFYQAAFGRGERKVEGAWEDGSKRLTPELSRGATLDASWTLFLPYNPATGEQ